jgi:hypothetical protein
MKVRPKIVVITEAGDKLPIQADKLLICLDNERNVEIGFNHPLGEITLLSYCGENYTTYPPDKTTNMSIHPGACNVIHINIASHDFKLITD